MTKTNLAITAGLSLGLGLAVLLSGPKSAVLGWTGSNALADATATVTTETPTATATPRNHGEEVSRVAHKDDNTPTATPTATATLEPTATVTAIPVATNTATATVTPQATVTSTATPASTDGTTEYRNHGAYVSEVARSTEPGEGHGAAVSAAAHSSIGKSAQNGDSDFDSDDEDDDVATVSGTPTAKSDHGQKNGHAKKAGK